MKYKATQAFIDAIRSAGLAYIESIAGQTRVEEAKNQKLADHIASNFGCQSNAVRELVIMLGWELPETKAKPRDESHPPEFAVVRLINTNRSINYKLGSLAVVAAADGISLGTIKDYDREPGYKPGTRLGNHIFDECCKRVETVEELDEAIAMLKEIELNEYHVSDYGLDGLVELSETE